MRTPHRSNSLPTSSRSPRSRLATKQRRGHLQPRRDFRAHPRDSRRAGATHPMSESRAYPFRQRRPMLHLGLSNAINSRRHSVWHRGKTAWRCTQPTDHSGSSSCESCAHLALRSRRRTARFCAKTHRVCQSTTHAMLRSQRRSQSQQGASPSPAYRLASKRFPPAASRSIN